MIYPDMIYNQNLASVIYGYEIIPLWQTIIWKTHGETCSQHDLQIVDFPFHMGSNTKWNKTTVITIENRCMIGV